MDYADWEPHYLRIASDFGFSIREDELAALRLYELAKGKETCAPSCLRSRMGVEATVVGDGPGLELELKKAPLRGTVIAADGATSTLMHTLGKVPDVIVTDLDGNVPDQLSANAQVSIVVILAHGDNVEAIERYVPWFTGHIVLTTQSRPFDGVHNFGGFTDGDRAVMLARHFGAKRIFLAGFDLDDPRPKEGKDLAIKRRKLEEARRLIWDMNPSDVEIVSSIALDG